MKVSKFKKNVVLGLLLLLSLTLLAACSQPAENPDPTAEPAPAAELELTAEELSAFNGKDGQPAYIAVDGVIYDVTEVSFWKNGDHNGFEAGQDLTDEIKTVSPHGVSKLNGLPVVGKLTE
ncbi:cytochrome b5 domain-containing protein [Acidaminobacter hydrogenoformans]|uniref:Predicted heme/steroid binding protein n=1 Tax=Acidaminobacter hydrogenoformans DSM 2784 TaxID=1120920 RepID=A0A1G5RUY3_9FIRM|nr:cytochrome b5 domain-containing protein [Acidaminobacter hydrogenoformans]SCZ77717.1 Predicted heme/steroid binding protein [Acidaminobacter hydrogenoformans DSM 2784]